MTIVPPLRAANTDAPKVSRPGCSKTMSTSSPPVSSRIRAPRRRHSLWSWVCSSFQNRKSSADRLMISSAPIARQTCAFSSFDTTQTGVAPPLRAYCVAKPPRPPEAPQIRTLSPCFMPAPLRETSWRYAVELTSPGEAASSQVRCARLGHQLVGLHQRDLGEAAEVGLEAPDPLLGVEHRVVVPVGALELDRQAVGDHLVAGLPRVHARRRSSARRRRGRSRPRGRAGRAAWRAGTSGRSARGSRRSTPARRSRSRRCCS